jgi:iron complex outermembrane recepter protein
MPRPPATLRASRLIRCASGGWLLLAVFVLCTASEAAAPKAPAEVPDIAPQELPTALAAFAEHTGLQLIYVSTLVEGKNSKGSHNGSTPADVLTQLLQGTGLRFVFLNAKTVQILPPAAHAARSPDHNPQRIVAAVAVGETVDALDEVVVTANRREQKQSDVPMSMMTWTGAMLAESGVKSLGDLATRTPGVEFDFYPDLGPGTLTNIAIRGVDARDGSTTGIFLGDTQIPGDSGGTFGKPYPFPFDMDRVEVLRGPQGTLLGEGTEGGAIRLIQASPSLSKMSGYAQGQVATTANGDPTYEIGAAGGGPLKQDVLGFRASAWGRWQGGYIDRVDPFTNQVTEPNANSVVDASLHGALTAAVGGEFMLTPAITYQSSSSQDAPTFTPSLSDPSEGALHNAKLLAQPARDEFTVASVTIDGPLRSAQLSAVTSYYHRTILPPSAVRSDRDGRPWAETQHYLRDIFINRCGRRRFA